MGAVPPKSEVILRNAEIQTLRVAPPKDLRAAVAKASGAARMRRMAIIALAIIVPLALLVVWRVIVALVQ